MLLFVLPVRAFSAAHSSSVGGIVESVFVVCESYAAVCGVKDAVVCRRARSQPNQTPKLSRLTSLKVVHAKSEAVCAVVKSVRKDGKSVLSQVNQYTCLLTKLFGQLTSSR